MAGQKMDIEKKKCMTPEFQASFPHVFKAHAFNEKQEAKFQLTMLFDKKTDLKVMKEAVYNAAVEKWGKKESWPKGLRMPFRDGNEKQDLQGYAGKIFVAATSKQRPGVVDGKRVPITEEDQQFYAGCYARATLIAFAYDKMGNKGVSFSLQNVQKLRDGEQFSGRRKAEDEFDDVEDGSDDATNYAGEASDEGMGF